MNVKRKGVEGVAAPRRPDAIMGGRGGSPIPLPGWLRRALEVELTFVIKF